MMKKFVVEMTEAENGYCYTGEWENPAPEGYIEAESEAEAIEFAKSYMNENGADADNYIYKAKEYWH